MKTQINETGLRNGRRRRKGRIGPNGVRQRRHLPIRGKVLGETHETLPHSIVQSSKY